ncbi:MAG: carboxylating nicotinate-nucleotide diphosphorylase [Chloroflexi bacterium]|nr:carboxylating nicotinate-nucleotide diphosphorylase [Chloroflexota bacterium]
MPPNLNIPTCKVLPLELQHPAVIELIELSLVEDLSPRATVDSFSQYLATGDVTSAATLDETQTLKGQITAKSSGIVAGLPVAEAVFKRVDAAINFEAVVSDGQKVQSGQVLATISGLGRAILTAERPALNFLGRLSGIATLTHRYVDAVIDTGTVILDTRKTAPGFRLLDKYAVRQGGGTNHRMGLFDMALIKDNHIDAAGSVSNAIQKVRNAYGTKIPIEVEVKDLEELQTALTLLVDRIMLDNMPPEMIRKAVKISNGRVPLEVSGNVNLETVRAIAKTGVDFISVGAITHSAPNFDVSLRLS